MLFNTRSMVMLLVGSLAFAAVHVHAGPLLQRGSASDDDWDPPKPSWMGMDYLDPKFINKEDKTVFAHDLPPVTFVKTLTGGINNAGVHITGDGHVVKFLRQEGTGYSEVKALKAKGNYIASGKLMDPQTKTKLPAIIMPKKDGLPLPETAEYKAADATLRKKMRKLMVDALCEESAEIAVTKHVYNDDNQLSNYLVTWVGDTKKPEHLKCKVELVDWGHFVHDVKQGADKPTKQQVAEFCHKKFDKIWL